MIKSLHIENWQSHKDTTLNLCDGVNVITGVPNSGKTAILRALLWLIENRPSGASQYMPTFAGDKCRSKVEVTLGDDATISLTKELRITKKGERVVEETSYAINEHEFSGTGTNVPDQVAEALNFDELNIQRQLDSPFVLSSSAGEIARLINRITHLEDVDVWISTITTRINTLKQKGELLGTDIKGIETRLEQYNNLPSLERIVEQCSKRDERLKKIFLKISKLDKHIEDLITYQNKIGFIQSKLRAEKYFIRIGTLVDKLKIIMSGMELISSLNSLQVKIDSVRVRVNTLGPVVSELQRLRVCLEKIPIQNLASIITSLSNLTKKYKETGTSCTIQKEAYLAELKKQKICPVCLSPINNDIMKHIEENL
jgi:DNA repair exonuclease SbcCD ATPase subunit